MISSLRLAARFGAAIRVLSPVLAPPVTRPGAVLISTNPNLESRQENEPALWLQPAAGTNGWISGEYPPYRIVDGDHFVSEIGCLYDNPQCDLLFRLYYRLSNGAQWSLGAWEESYDGDTTSIDVDLSNLAGEVVQFILTVNNQGRRADANAFWFMPTIQNGLRSANLVLSWHQQGGIRNTCDELKIYLYTNQFAEARAASCQNGVREIGRATLSSQDLRQLLEWIDRLSSFDGEVLTPSGGEPLTSYIVLRGRGAADASSTDIQTLQKFAERIYVAITR